MIDLTPQLFRRRLDALYEAQRLVCGEMELLAQAAISDWATLLRVAEAARSHREQAHSLLVMLLFQEPPADLVVEAEALVSFFSGTVEQIEVMLEAAQG